MGEKKKILFVASEAVPFCKSGGLADVCGALPKALEKLGHDVRLVLPRYWVIGREQHQLKTALGSMGVPMGTGTVWCSVLEGKSNGVTCYFVEHEGYFGRAGLYDDGKWSYLDNAERFGFFSKSAIQICKDLNFQPDIIHCHDWQTSLTAAYLKIHELHHPFFARTASVFTIHNIAYQGTFPINAYDYLGLGYEHYTEAKFENYGGINMMKGTIFFADVINTVSPSYAREILSEPGANGLSPYLERRREDVHGILNGVDYDHWDPGTDDLIPAHYSVRDMSGKNRCKEALQKEFLLEPAERGPVIGITTRFAHQKGFHLVAPIIKDVVRNMAVQFAIIGSGEKGLEDFFGGLPAEFPGKVGAWIGYNNHKAHLIEAGCDFFLMPSLYEPCGLNQIYSMKYGTLPIVRETGGIRDTVEQYHEGDGTGTGFCFHAAEPHAIYNTIGWAVSTYYDRPQHFTAMRKRAMQKNFSWLDAAQKYEELYERALDRRAQWHA
ncbi:MAG: glycogen synthase GlgA [Candidatus Omnitrophica bacterium]|nr:glycogen synthase GlgA [Candidatus Omnitrophota bacterium]MDD5670680.1 glycogen synthase GlgA [Candidatus Omnitrophota bacterium]